MGLLAVELALVSTPRFRRALERRPEPWARRVFSPAELAYGARKRDGAHNLAARFAAKCAGRRALRRLGLPASPLCAFEVVRHRSGEPTLAGPGLDGYRLRLSLSHDPAFAVAALWVEEASA